MKCTSPNKILKDYPRNLNGPLLPPTTRYSSSILHFHVLALIVLRLTLGAALIGIGASCSGYCLQLVLTVDGRNCVGILLFGLPRAGLKCLLPCLACCREPLTQSILLQVFPQDVVIKQIVFDDGFTKVFRAEPNAKLPVGCPCTQQLAELSWPRNMRGRIFRCDIIKWCRRLSWKGLTYRSSYINPGRSIRQPWKAENRSTWRLKHP